MNAGTYIRLRNWKRFQHYHDRNPPWIKLHRELLTSETWVTLDDASRTLAISLMLLAAGTENRTSADPLYLRRVAYLNSDPDLAPLVKTQFIDLIDEAGTLIGGASKTLAIGTERTSEKEAETETEKETDQRERARAPDVSRGTTSAEELYGTMLDDWRRDVPEVSPNAFARWIIHCELKGKMLGVPQRLAQAKHLAGQGDFDAQGEVVDWCVMQGYKSLMPIGDVRARRDGMTRGAAKPKPRWHPDDDEPRRP